MTTTVTAALYAAELFCLGSAAFCLAVAVLASRKENPHDPTPR